MYTDEEGDVDLNAAIEKGNMAIYSTLLEEEDLNVQAYMRNMFAYPTFRINIDNGEKVSTVSQVVLEYTGNSGKGFVVKSGLAHEKVYNLFTDNDDDFLDEKTETTDWSKVQTSDLILGETDKAYVTGGEIGYSKYVIAKLPKNTEFKRDGNTENKYIDVRFMIPGENIEMYDGTGSNGVLNLYIYTDNGILKLKDVEANIDWKKTTDKETKKLIFTRNSSYTLTLKKDNVEDGEDNYIVTTVDDWNNLVSEYGKSKNFVDTPLKVQVIGDDFAFGTDTKMPEVAIFEVTTPVSVKSDVTLSNVIVDETVTVEKGATLTTGEAFQAEAIENNGTMVIAPAYDEEDEVIDYGSEDYPGIGQIANYGKLSVEEKAVATFQLYNNEEGVVENNGEINISNLTVDEETGNYGVINNNSIINTNGFTNAAREYADDYEEGDAAINTPTINNNKGAKILAKTRRFVNNALIVNKGTLTCKNESGTIVNGADGKNIPAEIDATEAVLTYITENENGKIIVASVETKEVLTIGNGEEGIIEWTTDEASASFKNSLVNAVIAADDFTVTDGDINALTLTADAKVTLGKDAKANAIGKLNVEDGTATLASDLEVKTVSVAKGAQITVPEDITLTVTGTEIDNKGIILVGGVFKAEKIDAADGGQVEDNGKGEITWAPTSQQTAEAALTELVNAWLENSGIISEAGAAGQQVDSWAEITADVMTATDWTNEADWVKKAVEAYAKAVGLTNVTDAVVDKALKDNKDVVAAAVKAAKTAADAELNTAISEMSNEWLDGDVYIKAAADITDLTKITSETTNVAEAFKTYITSKYADELIAESEPNRPLWLSAKDYKSGATDKVTAVPAYSYIETYEEAEVYQAALMWYEASLNYAAETWFPENANFMVENGSGVEWSNNTMQRMASFYDQIYAVKVDDLTLTQQKAVKELKEMAVKVVEWKYIDEQIATLTEKVYDENKK